MGGRRVGLFRSSLHRIGDFPNCRTSPVTKQKTKQVKGRILVGVKTYCVRTDEVKCEVLNFI